MPGGCNFSRSETLLGLKRWDVTAACYFPPKAAVSFSSLIFLYLKAPHKDFQQSEGLFGQKKKKGVSILQKLGPFSFLCFVSAVGLRRSRSWKSSSVE